MVSVRVRPEGGDAMKKLINDPAGVVREELQGIEAAHPDLVRVSYDPHYVVRADAPVQG